MFLQYKLLSNVDDANFITIELGEEGMSTITADQEDNKNEEENQPENMAHMQPVVILNDIKIVPSKTKVKLNTCCILLTNIFYKNNCEVKGCQHKFMNFLGESNKEEKQRWTEVLCARMQVLGNGRRRLSHFS